MTGSARAGTYNHKCPCCSKLGPQSLLNLTLVAMGPGVRRDDEKGVYYLSCHSLVRLAISAVTASRIADGVREKRGAGAGWVTPWRLTKIFRAAMCGCCGASDMVKTGAKWTSVPSMISHRCSRVLVVNPSTSFCFSAGHALQSI